MLRLCRRVAVFAAAVLSASVPSTTASLRGDEGDGFADYCVEIQWQSDQTYPVHRMKLVSEKRADAAKAWAAPKPNRLDRSEGIPDLGELVEEASRFELDDGAGSEFHAQFFHVAVLSPVECATLHRRLEKMQQSDDERHWGYDALIQRNGERTARKLGSAAETCKFLREAGAEMDADTLREIEAFADPVDRILGAARSR